MVNKSVTDWTWYGLGSKKAPNLVRHCDGEIRIKKEDFEDGSGDCYGVQAFAGASLLSALFFKRKKEKKESCSNKMRSQQASFSVEILSACFGDVV